MKIFPLTNKKMVGRLFDFFTRAFVPQPVHCAGPPAKHGEDKVFWKATLSGGITGGIEACITYPTEFIKTMQQLYPEKRSGIIQVGKDTVNAHGFRGLYRGLSCLLFFSIPKTGTRFGSKEVYDKYIFTTPGKLNTFLSGACAGATEAVFVVTPMETLKVKLIHDRMSPTPKYRGLFHGISTIYKAEGFPGVYRGVVPTLIRQSSNQAIRFLVYGECKKFIETTFPNSPLTLQTALSGAIAGAASVLGNNPIDVVKTIMQGLEAKKYNGSLHCFFAIAKRDGIRGFYKGAGARLTRVVLDVAITFTLVEHIRNGLDYFFPTKK
ncbi:unnamed protein product [Blepharisma stoltei]|uniref:Uncharacterized protein n=1 Tax=Blepharisma stoltei TaxID=1481888 RepID=A0AAU9IST9_9CILI|nr:unnamed protein product [Blepharisma stoltei]